MNMRYKGYIWWAWLLLVLFSCTESEQAIEPVNPGEVRMSMNISTRAAKPASAAFASMSLPARHWIRCITGKG